MVNPENIFSEHGTSEHFKSKTRRLRPYAWSELHLLPKRRPLIKGLLDSTAMSLIFGESNCGKTFIALDLAANIARGVNWQGLKTRQGAVVYVAAEGGLGLEERLTAFRTYHEMSDYPPLYVIPAAIDLCNTESDNTAELIGEISGLGAVAVVVIDTLSRAMSGGNENAPDDMGAFIGNCDRIREETGAHVMVIHHCGKNSSQGARGHSALKAAVDTEIEVIKSDDVITAEVKKQRDGKTGRKFSFTLHQVQIGQDEDGESLSSCVLLSTDKPAAEKKSKLSPAQKRAMEIFHNLAAIKGERGIPKSGMPVLTYVRLDAFRTALKEANISAGTEPDSVRKQNQRVIEGMNNNGITATWRDMIWATGQNGR